MADKKLFEVFPGLDRAQWETIIKKELKGADPATLDVRIAEGITVPPFNVPGEGNAADGSRRGAKRAGNVWRSTVPLKANDEHANSLLLQGLMGGADAVEVHGETSALPEALKDVMLAAIDVQMEHGTPAALSWLIKEAQRQGVAPEELSLSADLPEGTDTTGLKELIAPYPRVRLFDVDDQRENGDAITSARSALRRGQDLLEQLLAEGHTISDACARIQFRLHLGDDLFMEVARIRALREAWA
ncbi:MAG TPA: methylmalonyl-CoA mutase family protein, partial [Flavobacteriales bacterium]|nr:methylmalonyl-CoA mutase family protein [Flavobacteriales bacterium]